MALLEYPRNVDDLSGDKGFQWRFHCDLCGSGYDSTFIPSKSQASSRRLGFLSGGLSAISGMAGSGGSGLSSASSMAGTASQFRGMSADWHKEHDNAFQQAVNEAKPHFQKCPRCNQLVCSADWNNEAGLCTHDAPSLAAETQAAKAQVRVEQMQAQVRSQSQFDGDTSDRSTICPKCGKPSGAGKFCNNCGAPLGFRECPSCHHQNPPTVNFCGDCGAKLG
ncbi:MAG TPA: zinc ribbon domain-containing protein [Thermoplasmata archaeon]|nr:zinc ribbon domain-containing protein [Thermoplasmata archaeon]